MNTQDGEMKNITVLYDSYSFDRETVGGVTRYFSEVIKRLNAWSVRAKISTQTTDNSYLQQEPFNCGRPGLTYQRFLPGLQFPGKYRLYRLLSRCFPFVVRGFEEINRKCFVKELKAGSFDLVHLTGLGYEWENIHDKKPIVVTIHDLTPELYGHDFKYDRQRRDVAMAATHVIAVSEHTRQDAIRYYNLPPERITTVYHGATVAAVPECVKDLEGVRYVLYVGKRSGYKNFNFFVRSLGSVFAEDGELHLVCTGKGFDASEIRLLEECGMFKRTVCHRFSDGELTWLYKNAEVFVYPSKYEGFGLPILDAFSAGCPVLLANASCFPEVAGDAALYFEPDDTDDFVSKIKRLLLSSPNADQERRDLVRRGKERVRQFTWDRCAKETADVYRKAIDEFARKSA